MIQAIIFDCFGVLTTDLWKEFVATLPEDQRAPAGDFNRAYDSGQLSRQKFLQDIEGLTGRQPSEVENLLSEETYKNVELLNFIAELKKQYKIGLLSNIATNWITEQFLTTEEQQLFDVMVFSHHIGASKPDAKMFETIAGRLDLPLENCVMIDDSERYCSAAADLGMQGIYYQDLTQLKQDLERILKACS